jgi:outer membrane protein assembly factor BamB
MSEMIPTQPAPPRSLRLWPGCIAALLIIVAGFVIPALVPGSSMYGFFTSLAASVVIAIWWLFFSRAPWLERIGAIVVMMAAVFATSFFVHLSIAGGMMGMMLTIFSLPMLALALVGALVISRQRSDAFRRVAIVIAVLLACGLFTIIRTDGLKGGSGSQLAWRWTPTAEERLLAQTRNDPAAMPPAAPAAEPAVPEAPKPAPEVKPEDPTVDRTAAKPAAAAPSKEAPVSATVAIAAPEWPGFRGPRRDSVIHDLRINTDWEKTPPVEVWRRPIGPGWSSFAVQGDRLYTQEQRGEEEIVSCYNAATGAPIWMHRDKARFYESNGGAGPRATPTLHDGRVYTLGATGIVNVLDAATGRAVWSRNAEADTGAPRPGWGFAGSPLVVGDLVIVAASGRLAAYDLATGHPRWTRATGGGGYSSPHLATIDGVPQILLPTGGGVASVALADGALLWQQTLDGVSILQPAFTPDGDLLIATGDMMGGAGIRRMSIKRASDGWTVEGRWTSRGLKPYFNDFVVHEGHGYGFDGSILAAIDLTDGTRKWKGGRYGNGQLVLLPEQDLLLVLSEEGDLALVAARPNQFTELARFAALEGKTWNHPVIVGDFLFVRNGEEMAAFRLPVTGRESK